MNGILWRLAKSLVYRTAELAYRILPKKGVLTFYCYMTYMMRAVTWRLACKYYGEAMAQHRGDTPEFVLSHISSRDTVIDVGCAEGNLTRLIAAKAKRVVAVEMDKRYLDMIDKGGPGLGNVTFINGDIVSLELGETFDAAVLIHAIEHMDNADAVLRKISVIARAIIVETPDQRSDWLASTLEDLGIEERGDDKHVRLYDAMALKDELERSGWEDVIVSKGNGALRAIARSKLSGASAPARSAASFESRH
jgi:SAM-dependent methyltransferase